MRKHGTPESPTPREWGNAQIFPLIIRVTKSKEVEADNVVLVNFKNDKLGFPNQIADDKVLNFVFTQGENYMFAEERRADAQNKNHRNPKSRLQGFAAEIRKSHSAHL